MKARSVVILCVSVFGVMLFLGRRLFQWGYWVEPAHDFPFYLSGKLESRPESQEARNAVQQFASEICGESVSFDGHDPLVYCNLWPEQSHGARHFFMYGPYSGVAWVTLGSPRYLCSARFLVTMKRHDCFWPFAYCNRWSYKDIESVRLLSRTRKRPQVPPGVQPLMPGECAMGRLVPGESRKFRTEVPDLGEYVEVTANGVREFVPPAARNYDELAAQMEMLKKIGMGSSDPIATPEVTIERNGRMVHRYSQSKEGEPRPPNGSLDTVTEKGGGAFDITLKAPENSAVAYQLVVRWGDGNDPGCPRSWDLRDKMEDKDSH